MTQRLGVGKHQENLLDGARRSRRHTARAHLGLYVFANNPAVAYAITEIHELARRRDLFALKGRAADKQILEQRVVDNMNRLMHAVTEGTGRRAMLENTPLPRQDGHELQLPRCLVRRFHRPVRDPVWPDRQPTIFGRCAT